MMLLFLQEVQKSNLNNSPYSDKLLLDSTINFIIENDKETLAQVFTDNRYTIKDNITFSKALLSILEKQGFMNNE